MGQSSNQNSLINYFEIEMKDKKNAANEQVYVLYRSKPNEYLHIHNLLNPGVTPKRKDIVITSRLGTKSLKSLPILMIPSPYDKEITP
ncbi:hypothetical protein M8J75_001667 [Diaphorina citri]|nr:hypothetical protein M8J75_001667 [Diaphorina citri]